MSAVKDAAYFLSAWSPMNHDNSSDTPAELFDTHPLSEMILTSEAESSIIDSLVLVENQWRPEWHRNGVQVPVNSPSLLRKPSVRRVKQSRGQKNSPNANSKPLTGVQCEHSDGPSINPLHTLRDDYYRSPLYQVDDLDYAWLSVVNDERECLGLPVIAVWMFERVMESLEHLSYIKMLENIKALEAESLEFDENAKCDICLSYEGEDGNELVFCDGCLLCVHQACYGIPHLPEGSWICRQCEAGVKSTTPCYLCPNTGGAMKTTEDGTRWCHISCALWVPEVSFGNVDLMEPVIRLECIPQARRRLLCCICRSRYGAPIQCSHKKCKIAFHVTCAFQNNLTMRQELVEKDVHLVSLCPRHSRKGQKSTVPRSPKCTTSRGRTSAIGGCSKQKSDSPGSSSDLGLGGASVDRKEKLLNLESNFYKLVDDKELEFWISGKFLEVNSKNEKSNSDTANSSSSQTVCSAIPHDIRSIITVYWRLKRRTNFNQPLISPTPFHWRETASRAAETTKEALAQAERAAADVHAFELFRRIRFGLDRSRLVVDMVLQRERRKLALFRRMWRIFDLQARLFSGKRLPSLSPEDFTYFSTAHIGNSVYDNWNLFERYTSQKNQQTTAEIVRPEISSSSVDQIVESESKKEISCQATPDSEQFSNHLAIHENERSKPADTVLYTIPYEQLIIPEDIRQRLRSALNSVKHSPKHRLFFKQTLQRSTAEPCKPVTRDQLRKRTLSPFPLQNSLASNDCRLVAQPILDDEVPATPAKRFKRLNLNYSASGDDSFSSHSIPILAKFAMVKFAGESVNYS